MKEWKKILFALIFVLVASAATQTVYANEPYEKITNANEWEVLKLVNKEREAKGLEPLTIFASLQTAAGVRAKEIIDSFSHVRPDGTTCFTAISEQGIAYNYAGENIASGYESPSSVMSGWMTSTGHSENILSDSYSHIGVGYCTGGSYGKNWVQIFIGGCSVKSITVNENETANYPVGTSIDKMNRYLIVRCSDHGVGYVPITNRMCSGYNANKTGSQTITVSYRGKKVTIPVTIGDVTSEDETSGDETSGDETSVTKPAKVKKLTVAKKTKSSVTLTWKKRSGNGYEVWMAKSKNGRFRKVKTLTAANRTSYKVKNLKSGRKYYFKVRAYKKVNNKKIYGLFSKAVVVKTK